MSGKTSSAPPPQPPPARPDDNTTPINNISPFAFSVSAYLPPDAATRLSRYKYHGEDHSLIFNYFWRPLCNASVHYVPMWVAPNLITVTGLVGVIVAHALIATYMPLLQVDPAIGEPPAWIFVYAGVSMFVYQFLDNLDGIQARRTGEASPLGLLLDHGCDAINVGFSSLTISAAIGHGPTWKTFATLLCCCVVFFMNTYEEFYRGALVLPIVNGPNEGIFAVIATYMATAAWGTAYWREEVALPSWLSHSPVTQRALAAVDSALFTVSPPTASFTAPPHVTVSGTRAWLACSAPAPAAEDVMCVVRNTLPLLLMLGMGVATIAQNIYQVWFALSDDKRRATRWGIYARGWVVDRFPFMHALARLVPLLAFSAVAVLWFVVSPTDVFKLHPRLYCWTVAFLITKLTLHLMVAHICSMEMFFGRTLVPFFVLALHCGVHSWVEGTERLSSLNESVLLAELFVLAALSYAHAVVNIIWELSTVLGRRVFMVRGVKKL